MIEAEVVESLTDEYEDDTGQPFEVQHLTVDVEGVKFAVDLWEHHVDVQVLPGDTLYCFAGWAKDVSEYVHPSLRDEYRHQGEFWIRNYSGVRNVTRHPLAD